MAQGKASQAGESVCKGPEVGARLLRLKTAERPARLQQSEGTRGDQGLLGDKPPVGRPWSQVTQDQAAGVWGLAGWGPWMSWVPTAPGSSTVFRSLPLV